MRLPSFVAGPDPEIVRAAAASLVTTLPISSVVDLAIDFRYVPGASGAMAEAMGMGMASSLIAGRIRSEG